MGSNLMFGLVQTWLAYPLIYGTIPLGKMMFQTIKFEDTVFSDKPICPLEIKGWYERCHRRYSCSLNPKEKGSWVEATKYQKWGGIKSY